MQETAMRVAVRFGILLQLALTLYGSDTEAILSPLGFGIGQATVDLSSVEYTASEESGFLTIQLVANQTVTDTEEVTVVFTSNSSKLNLESDLNLGGNSILLTFENGSMESNFTIGIIDDNIYEDTEILFATIMNTSMGLVEGCNVSAMITIIDNDEVNVSSSVVSNSVAEGGTVDLLLIADAPGGGVEANVSVVITIMVVDGTAEGTDYWVTDQLVIFEPFPNNSTMYVSVLSVADDNIVEEDETLVVMVIATGDRVSFTLTEANITIVDNDYMEVEFSQGSYSVAEEAGVLVVEVVANATAEDNVTVTIYTQNVTAFALSDYIVEPVGFAVIPAGSMSVNYSITIVNDVLFEELFEYFMLNITTISNPYLSSDKISIGKNSFTNASIEDNEVINIFVAVESRVNEYSNVEVTVNATYPAGGLDAAAQLYLDVSVTDNTTDSTDYGMLDPISITFFPQDSGMFSSMHTFQLNNDDVVEIDEVFLLTLSNSDSRFSLAIQTTEVTIIDDDYMEVDFSLSSYSIGEGSGVLVVEIAANATADGDVSVFIAFQSFTASDKSDYMEPAPFAVIPAGSMSIDYNISIIDDDCFEEQFEYFMLSITSITSPSFSSDKFSIGTNSPTTATIEDNEVIAIDVVVESRVNEYSKVAVTVDTVYPMGGLVLNVPLFLDVSVIDNTTDSNDYVMLDRITFVLPQGSFPIIMIVQLVPLIYNDDVVEIDELFLLTLSNNDSRILFSNQTTEVTIIDDDFLELNFNVTDYTVVENDGVATVSISANTTAGYVFAVNLKNTAISATIGADFVSGNISVIFQPGSMSASANSTIIDDDAYEGFESFNSSIISVTSEISSDKFILGSTIETTITIQDDEMLEIVATITPTAIEGEGFLLMFALTIPSGGVPNMAVLQLDVLFTDITTTPSDYFNFSTITVNLVPPVGNQILNGSISILEDDILEASESFTFDLSVSAETQALHNLKFTPPAAPNNVVTIEDNDVLTVDFEMAYYSVNESEVVLNVVVVANGTSSVDFQVDFAFADITTNGDINLTASFSRNFTAGVPNITIQVFIDDDIFEDAENASLSISSTGNPRVLIGSISEAIITIEDNEILYVTVPTIIQLILESAGFASATVDFTLPPGGTEVNITLPVSFSDGTATQPLDYYVLEPNILLYSTTSLLASLMYDVSIVDDSIFEVDENFFLAVYSTNPRIVSSGSQEFVIGNNDVISVELPASSYNVSEADGSMTLMLTLNGTSPFDIRINFTITDVTTNAYDYNLTGPFYVTIPAGYSNASITINIDDKVFENEESFIVQLRSTSSADVLLGPVYSTSVYIQDDEEIALYFAYSNFTVAESVSEASVGLNAMLPSGGLAVNITVNITYVDGSAVAPYDYFEGPSYVTLYPTSNSSEMLELLVPIIDNAILERDEYFSLQLSTSYSRVTASDSTTVTILNDDTLSVGFTSSERNVSEGSGSVRLSLIADGTSSYDYSVYFSIADVTTNAYDYNVSGPYNVTIPAGYSNTSITINIDDNVFENEESFTVHLSSTSSADVLLGQVYYSVYIQDDEEIALYFAYSNFTVAEIGIEALLGLNAILPSGGLAVNITVNITYMDGSAVVPYDYFEGPIYVTLYPTSNSSEMFELLVPIIDDAILERDEYFSLQLSTSYSRVTANNSATVTILNDDALSVEFTYSEHNISESSGYIQLGVLANGTSPYDYSVFFSIADVTTNAYDYNLTGPYNVTIPAGYSNASITINIDDKVFENEESFIVQLRSTSSADVLLGPVYSTSVYIQDDEEIALYFAYSNFTVAESVSEASVGLNAMLPSGGLAVNITVNITYVDGSAVAPNDYFEGPSYVTLYPTSNSSEMFELLVPIIDDAIPERAKYFSLQLSTSYSRVTASDSTIVTILNDDALSVEFAFSDHKTSESAGYIELSVLANGTSSFDYSVYFNITDVTTNAYDYNVSGPYNVTIPAGYSNASITINIDDKVFENEESFIVQLRSTSSADVLLGPVYSTSVYIQDDEEIVLYFAYSNFTVAESVSEASVGLNAMLPSGGLAVNITVSITYTNGSAVAPYDYYERPSYVTLYPTSNSSEMLEVLVPILDDAILERDEYFSLQLSTSYSRVTANNSAIVTILNDDTLSVGLTFSERNVSESQGFIRLDVLANGTSSYDYAVYFNITDVTTNADDYSVPGPYSVTIPAGYSNASITINIDDKVFENEESFIVQLSSTSSADVLLGPVYSTSVYIQDDEEIALYFAYSNFTVAESYGQLLVTIAATLPTGGSEVTATVAVTFTDGTALVDKDYVYNANSTSFTLYPTSNITLTHQLWVTIIDDQMAEAYLENFYISLGVNFSRVVTKLNTTVVYIEDDDAIMVEFQSNSTTVSEGGTANMTVVANRTSAVTYTVSLALLDVTTNSRDYVTPNLTYTLYPGETTFVISIETFDDSIFEGTEYLTVVIHNTSEPLILIGSNNYSIVAISDNEAVEVSFSEASFRASEASLNSEAVVEMTAVLPAGGTSIPIEVMINAQPATAREMFDFNQPGVLSFTDPTGLLAFIPLVDDTVAEPDEYLTLNLSVVTEGVFFRLGSATLSISDNDECPCQNGGICEFFQDQLNCTCAPGFLGGECQTSIAQPLEQLTTPIAVGVSSGVVALGIVIFMIIILVLIVLRKRK